MGLERKTIERARSFLNKTFEEKIKRNPQYSLRAYARSLDINASTLSQILSGKRPITAKRLRALAPKFEMSGEEFVEKFSSSKSIKEMKFKDLSIDLFHCAAEWYHDAILELTHLDDFTPDIKWISDKLDINYNQAKLAVDRLQRLGLLQITDYGEWIDTQKDNLTSFDTNMTNTALKKYQKQLLQISLQSVDKQQRGQRDHTSFLYSMDKDLLPEVHKKIKDFEIELMDYIEQKSQKKDHIQALQVSSFSLVNDLKEAL